MPPWHWTRCVWTIGQQTAALLLGTGSPWIETIQLHKVIFNHFSYETLVRSVQNIFQVVFPLCCLLVLTLCILLVVLLLPPPPPDYYPASQWSVVVVSFHWCMGSNLVASPLQVSGTDSLRQINIGHINLTSDDDSKSALSKLWPLTQQHRLPHKSLSVLALCWRENERTFQC